MKAAKLISVLSIFIVLTSCNSNNNRPIRLLRDQAAETLPVNIPLDKGFSEYISGYTSGIIPANSSIEIRFTPQFAAKANKSATGLFIFEPSVKGRTEWKDETTLVFTPSRLLDPGKTYEGGLNLNKLSEVKERLSVFPIRIQTLKKDFRVITGALECPNGDGSSYLIHGRIVASDFIEPTEAEGYIIAKLGRKKMDLIWDHSVNPIHKFTISGIERTKKSQELLLSWDGSAAGVKQKGSFLVNIPPTGDFNILDVITVPARTRELIYFFPILSMLNRRPTDWYILHHRSRQQ